MAIFMTKACKEIAEMYGLQNDTLFLDTFKMYEEQKALARKLKKSIDKDGLTIEKEYVKGRPNICANPAIDSYNKTMTALNNTVQTLKKMIKDATGGAKAGDEIDKLLEVLGQK